MFHLLLCEEKKSQNMTIPQFSTLIKSLEGVFRKKDIKTVVLYSEIKLREFIYETIPDNCIVGIGNSLTNSAIKIKEILIEKGNKVYFSWNGASYNRSLDSFEEHPIPEFFLICADTINAEEKLFDLDFQNYFPENVYPKHIIAFSKQTIIDTENENISDYKTPTSFKRSSDATDFTIVILPFLKAS